MRGNLPTMSVSPSMYVFLRSINNKYLAFNADEQIKYANKSKLIILNASLLLLLC